MYIFSTTLSLLCFFVHTARCHMAFSTECMDCWIECLGWYQCWCVVAITVVSLDCCCFWLGSHCCWCRSHHWIDVFSKAICRFVYMSFYYLSIIFCYFLSFSYRSIYACGSKRGFEICMRELSTSKNLFQFYIWIYHMLRRLNMHAPSLSLSLLLSLIFIAAEEKRSSVEKISWITRKNIIGKASTWVCCILNLI